MTVTSDLALSLAKEAEAEGIDGFVAAAVVTDADRVRPPFLPPSPRRRASRA
ncbi:hypothetical protein [Streptomyces sp. NPDC127033]|uniref:hypothetical protein n=1 Tax=Streptomyces sp. NPDC127033 TaxID=3347110 RepID=UPI00364EACD7